MPRRNVKGRLIPTVMAEVATDDAIEEAEQKAAFQDKWAQDCGWAMTAKPGEQAKPYKSLVQRVLGRLVKSGLVKKAGDGHSLTPAGNKVAKNARKIVPDVVAESGTIFDQN
jgi:hypothetical protein